MKWCDMVCTEWNQDGSSFTWHQPRNKQTALNFGGYFLKCYWKLVIHWESTCEHSESAREWRIALYKSDQQLVHMDRPWLTNLFLEEGCEKLYVLLMLAGHDTGYDMFYFVDYQQSVTSLNLWLLLNLQIISPSNALENTVFNSFFIVYWPTVCRRFDCV